MFLSDSRGEDRRTVVKAAAAQFDDDSVEIVRVPNIHSVGSNEHEDEDRTSRSLPPLQMVLRRERFVVSLISVSSHLLTFWDQR